MNDYVRVQDTSTTPENANLRAVIRDMRPIEAAHAASAERVDEARFGDDRTPADQAEIDRIRCGVELGSAEVDRLAELAEELRTKN